MAIATTLALLAPNQINTITTEMQDLMQQVVTQLEQRLATPITFFGYSLTFNALVQNIPVISAGMVRPDVVWQWLQAASTNLGWILVILVSTYYLLQDWGRLRTWLINLMPDGYREDAERLYLEIREVWQRYLRGQLRLSFIVGVLTALLLAAVGMPGSIAFGILAAIFDVILTIGPAFVMISAAVVAYITGSTYLPISPLWFALLVLGLFSLVQSVENIWLRPRVMGQSLNMHPGIVFVAIIAALSLAGILVALIIVPLMGSTAVIARYLHAKILDVPPWPPQPPVEVATWETETSLP
jgi:predicted PurR-regulated permease PerM